MSFRRKWAPVLICQNGWQKSSNSLVGLLPTHVQEAQELTQYERENVVPTRDSEQTRENLQFDQSNLPGRTCVQYNVILSNSCCLYFCGPKSPREDHSIPWVFKRAPPHHLGSELGTKTCWLMFQRGRFFMLSPCSSSNHSLWCWLLPGVHVAETHLFSFQYQ